MKKRRKKKRKWNGSIIKHIYWIHCTRRNGKYRDHWRKTIQWAQKEKVKWNCFFFLFLFGTRITISIYLITRVDDLRRKTVQLQLHLSSSTISSIIYGVIIIKRRKKNWRIEERKNRMPQLKLPFMSRWSIWLIDKGGENKYERNIPWQCVIHYYLSFFLLFFISTIQSID